jgi:hypothetical protein
VTLSTRNMQLQLYLDRYELTTQIVAAVAKVPLMTLWRAMQGQPITTAHAAAIRQALWRLSGDFYTGPIEANAEALIDLPTHHRPESRGM